MNPFARKIAFVLAPLMLGWLSSASAAPAKKASVPDFVKSNVAPLPPNEKAAWSHAPFESGDCRICHKNADPKNPGPITTGVNEQCFGCHEDFVKILSRKSGHAAAKKSCVNCHNPHNARYTKLLLKDPVTLCLSCHEDIKAQAVQAKVKHDPVTKGGNCANCHNPHGANVEHLLIQLSFRLCIDCHGKDGVTDEAGRKLTNIRQLMKENPKHHGPVASEDCSSCHKPHGSDNFRLLTVEYPATFYSPYDPKLYALCFECHDSRVAADPETTTLTGFRDGSRNLHYIHINKAERGRTCRACHEVHASKMDHQLRDAVPYGQKGWLLKVNYTRTATGGSCARTCHGEFSYNNSAKPPKTGGGKASK